MEVRLPQIHTFGAQELKKKGKEPACQPESFPFLVPEWDKKGESGKIIVCDICLVPVSALKLECLTGYSLFSDDLI